MARQTDPRAEALAVSRHRQNSLKREDQENLPPQESSKPFTALKASFEDLSKTSSENSNRRHFGSKVGRLKSMFQSGHVGKNEKSGEDLLKSPPSPNNPQNIPHIELDRSPETKRKKVGELNVPKVHVQKVEPSPTRHDPKQLERASHVERFNYTRALFAKMEEESRQANERQARLRHRTRSPGGTSSSTSPVLSPISSTPTSPDGRKRSPSHEFLSKSASHDSLGKQRSRSSSDPSRIQKISYRSNTDPTQVRPRSENYDDPNVGSVFSRSEGNLRGGNFPNAPGGLLYKRRSQEDEVLEELQREAKANGEQLSHWSEKDVRAYSSSHSSVKSPRREDEYQSQYSSPNNATQNRRSRRDQYISSAYQPKHSQSSTVSVDETDSAVVIRRKKPPSETAQTIPSKRLSKEDIQAAIDRADIYLSHVSSPENTPEKAKERQKRHSQIKNTAKSEIDESEFREWTKNKYHRNSPGSQKLDDQSTHAEATHLDENSSIGKNSSNRWPRGDKSPSPSPISPPKDSLPSNHSSATSKAYMELQTGDPNSAETSLNVPMRPGRGGRRSSPGPPLPAKPAHLINGSYKTSVDPEDGLTQITSTPRPKAVYLTGTSSQSSLKSNIPPPPSYQVATGGVASKVTPANHSDNAPIWGDDDVPDSLNHTSLLSQESVDIIMSQSDTSRKTVTTETMEEMTEEEADILLSKR